MNIYQGPKGPLITDDVHRSTAGQKIICSLLAALALLAYLAQYLMIPDFAEVFASFGPDVPGLTAAFLAIRPLLLVLAISSVLLNAVWLADLISPGFAGRLPRLAIYNFALSLVMLVAFFIAMYLPVIQGGQVS